MWQILLATAVVGTGFLAKHFFSNGFHEKGLSSPQLKKISNNNIEESVYEVFDSRRENSVMEEKPVFRFSSSGTVDGRESKGLRRRIKSGMKRIETEKKSGFVGRDQVVEGDHRKKGRRGFACLRKRTGWNSFQRCRSSSSEGRSIFNSGIGVGLMCFVSAGKVEIDKLNAAVDEATQVVNGLKSVLNKRKGSCDLQDSSRERIFITSPKAFGKDKQRLTTKSTMEGPNSSDTKVLVPHLTDDDECASSVLTEEQEQEILEIDQLEAELESELQKLSRCTSKHPSGRSFHSDLDLAMDATKSELSAADLLVRHAMSKDYDSIEFQGVSPLELDRELCNLLIEQQNSQIVELQTSLHSTETKLSEKAAEVKALKNRVHNIREFSLQTLSDKDFEEPVDLEREINGDANWRLFDNSNKESPTGRNH